MSQVLFLVIWLKWEKIFLIFERVEVLGKEEVWWREYFFRGKEEEEEEEWDNELQEGKMGRDNDQNVNK